MQNMIKLGAVYTREGKHAIRICGKTADGKFIARQILPAVKTSDLLRHFSDDMLVAGTILRYPSGRTIQLVHDRGTGYWDNVFADEIIEYTAEDLENLQAETHAAIVYSSVVPANQHGHPFRNPNHAGSVRTRMDDEPPE